MHAITSAASRAGYGALANELKGTHGNVAAFMNLAQEHGAFVQSSSAPRGTAAIMSLRGNRPDHVGISLGGGVFREANPGFYNARRSQDEILGYVDLGKLNKAIQNRRKGSELDIPGIKEAGQALSLASTNGQDYRMDDIALPKNTGRPPTASRINALG